jgi:hypothetical protein
LALAESMTRMADRTEAVPDEVWDEAAKRFDEQQLAGLVLWSPPPTCSTGSRHDQATGCRILVDNATTPGKWRLDEHDQENGSAVAGAPCR